MKHPIPSPTGPALAPEEAASLLRETEHLLLIDLRTDPDDLADFALDRAVNIASSQLRDRIGALAPDLNRPIMIVCGTGAHSRAAVLVLHGLGYTGLYNGGSIYKLGEALGLHTPTSPENS